MSNQLAIEHPVETITADLRIHLLGPPRAEWAGQTFAVPRRQTRALLYRLAAGMGPVSREHLCFLFWPDTPESTARRKLSRLLTHLRRALPVPAVLVISGDQVGLNSHRAWSDTATFERLCAAQNFQRQATTLRQDSAQALQQAVDLYRGPFLHGFSLPDSPEFEAWATLEGETWQRLYLEILAALIDDRLSAGEYAAAITYARRYLATDDLAEDIHRRLIEIYAAVGDRSAALHQFERCVTVLERELGVSPLPETQAAYRAVLAGQSTPPVVAPATRPVWATLPGLDVPLTGREKALFWLEQEYTQVRTGHRKIALISGEPGIGKSRLMQEFATRLQGQPLILAGAGYPDTQTVPYQPIVEALRPALSVLAPMFETQPFWLAEASRLMPELRTMFPDLPSPTPTEPDEAPTRLFEALCQLIMELAIGPRPVVLCLDDLHWADSITLNWLVYLGRRLRGGRLLVLGTYRGEETDAMTKLRQGLARQGILSELNLAGLDETAVLQLLRQVGGPAPGDRALASRLQQATGGNPFFLLETLRVLIESEGRLDRTSLEDLPLPDTVRDVVKAQVERLSPKARQVLEAGAVLGQTFVFNAVHLTAGRREMETMDGLDELAARQLLVEQVAGYQFRHEIAWAAVYRDLGHLRRRLLHRRAGEAMEKLEPNNATALLWHFGRAEESERAAKYALQAGQAAKAVFAHAEASIYFDRALALLQQEAARLQDLEAIATNQRLQIQAISERGWALRLLGDMEAFACDSQEVARLAKMLDDQRALAHLRWREAYAHHWFCCYTEAREAAEEGLRLSQAAADPLLEALCRREVGKAARATGDYDRAQTALERALSFFVDLGEVVYEIHTLGNLSTLYCYLGKHEQAMNLARQALTRCDEAGLPLERRLPLGDIGAAAGATGDLDLARRCLLESLTIARQIEDRTQEILCLGHLGWLCVREKRAARALEHLKAAMALTEDIDSRTEQSWLRSGLAEAHRLVGNRDQGATHARLALELAQACGQAHDERLARRILHKLGEG